MIGTVVKRVRRMSRDEASWRLRTLARLQQQRVTTTLRRSRWERSHLAEALAPAALDAGLRGAIDRADWPKVNARLISLIAGRRARFVLDPSAHDAMRQGVLGRWPDAAVRAAADGDRILSGRFDLLGYQDLSFAGADGETDWHLDPVHGRRMPLTFWGAVPYLDPRFGDHKVIWELNRHQHWLALGRALWLTGDSRYADAILRDLESWLGANPPLMGANWASMLELGFRSMSWTWALHFLLADRAAAAIASTPWLVDLLVGIDRQLTHVAHNLSRYFSPNTHLTGEALALYVVGSALPELKRSAEWVAIGRDVLLTEIDRQIAADGGHAERSMHYHRYTLDFYLLALLTAERTGDDVGAARFREVVPRLATFMAAMSDAEGRFPQIGDDDGGMLWPMAGRDPSDVRDSLALAAVTVGRPELARWGAQEEVAWIAGVERLRSLGAPVADRLADRMIGDDCSAQVFSDTGYVALSDSNGDHLVFDVGAHGYLNGGHAHADALAVTLGVGGRPLLVDPGTSTYTMNAELRDRLRSTALHNTVTVDGASSSVAAGPFHWLTRTDARLQTVRGNRRFTWAAAAHSGFDNAEHRRSIVHGAASGWLIVDEILGRGRHRADTHWHFDPAWSVTCEGRDCLRATGEAGSAWVLHDRGALWLVHGDEESGLGWCAPNYGALLPTSTARVTRTAVAPFAMVTWIGHGDRETPRLERLEPQPEGEAGGITARVTRDGVAWTTLLRAGDAPDSESAGCGTPEFHGNARLLQYGMRGDAVIALSLADFTHVLARRDGLLSITAGATVPDLHLALDGAMLDLWCTAPPDSLRIEGELLAQIRRLRLNGVDQPRLALERPSTLVLERADWVARQQPEPFDRKALCVA